MINKKIENYNLTVNFNNDFDNRKYLDIAVRENKKRNFLFISKVLGKHVAMSSTDLIDTAGELARLHMNHHSCSTDVKFLLEHKTLFIGFAETATGLAHAVFENYEGNGYFINTTRSEVDGIDPLEFKEEHSHATDQKLFLRDFDFEEVVLIDDEISTGKTILNIIDELLKTMKTRKFSVLSILDFRSMRNHARYDDFCKENDIEISVYSLGQGEYSELGNTDEIQNELSLNDNELYEEFNYEELIVPAGITNNVLKSLNSCKTMINSECSRQLNDELRLISAYLSKVIEYKNSLFLGNEEFIYIPMKIAEYIDKDIAYHSTTRSPIKVIDRDDYPIRNGIKFKSPHDTEVDNYIYNLIDNKYDYIYFVFERKKSICLNSLKEALRKNCIYNVKFIFLGE